MQNGQVRTQCLEDLSSAGRGRPPTEIQHDRHPIQPQRSNGPEQRIAVAGQQIVPLVRTTAAAGGVVEELSAQASLDAGLTGRTELGAIGSEHLDAVVGGRVVAGGHHQTAGSPDLTDQQRHRRGRTQPKVPDVAAGGGETGGQGRHQHAAAAAGIHADQHRAIGLKHPTDPVSDLQAQGRCQHRADMASDSVGAEPRSTGTERRPNRLDGALSHDSRSWTKQYEAPAAVTAET